ncbi:MAG: DUF1883 domain-containing protein [Anaerolineales bacterium]|nr:DUF1883 domain-containing protein [Anaerolineales bacterium]
MKDHYATLGVSPEDPLEEIRERYRRLVTSCHPDKFLDIEQKTRAEEMIKQINEAYEVLSDPARRASYDRQRTKEKQHRQVVPRSHSSPFNPGQSFLVTPVEELIDAPAMVSWNVVDHLHYVFYANREDLLEVGLSREANVILLDEPNYIRYRAGGGFRYWGGYMQESPTLLPVPYLGIWHLAIDLGGHPGKLRATARLIRRGW